jgi:hypothetical protein
MCTCFLEDINIYIFFQKKKTQYKYYSDLANNTPKKGKIKKKKKKEEQPLRRIVSGWVQRIGSKELAERTTI